MIVIRKATLQDEAGIFDLLRQLLSGPTPTENPIDRPISADTFREIVSNDEKGSILVAEQDDDIVGVITLSYPVAIRCGGIYSCIEEFIVSERIRGKGVGGQLLEAAIDQATSKDCREIQVNRPSEMSYPLYLQHGWKDLGKHLNMRLPRQAP